MTTTQKPTTVDVNIPRFNQSFVAVAIAVAFVIDAWWIVALVAVVLTAAATLGHRANFPAKIYTAVVREIVDPGGPSEVEDAGPPQFATRLGAFVTAAATVAFILGWTVVGWVLAGVVGALALLAATARICVGCLIYEKTVT